MSNRNNGNEIKDWSRELGERAAEFGEQMGRWGAQWGWQMGRWNTKVHFWPGGGIMLVLILLIVFGIVLSLVFKALPWVFFGLFFFFGIKVIGKKGWGQGEPRRREHGDDADDDEDIGSARKRKNDEVNEAESDFIDLDEIYSKPKREGGVTHV